jgi:hypothetical protein
MWQRGDYSYTHSNCPLRVICSHQIDYHANDSFGSEAEISGSSRPSSASGRIAEVIQAKFLRVGVLLTAIRGDL